MAKKVEKWEASDGSLWSTKTQADVYEKQIELVDYINSNDCTVTPDSSDGRIMVDWVAENSRLVLMLLPEGGEPDDSKD